ncbi:MULTISPECIES: hypothetical protein [unclassified Hyphomonas]|uniref:hypothetical protein n=1 Tax=unclassified Hyphomonas TaxID=2630699 RepID=UPI000458F3C0|nr:MULTISPECIES: hypothetical protein [unclassified Hyphomonas]KCZ49908.1 hypothetical protein HY17_02050 [Hyphomonas sp. CY54-11-8]
MKNIFELSDHYKRVIKSFQEDSLCILSLFDECDEKAINSHSISSTSLRLISENSEVIRFGMNMASKSETGFLEERPITLRLASCFKGFCQKHDNLIFREIDSDTFQTTQENMALYLFRATAQELFKKTQNLAVFSSYEIYDENVQPSIEKQAMEYGTLLGLKDIHAFLVEIRGMIEKSDYSRIKFASVQFSDHLPFSYLAAVNFRFFPQYHDVDPDAETSTEGAALAVIPSTVGSRFFLIWLEESQKIIVPVLNRFKHAKSALHEFVFQLGLEHSENFYFQPSWFRSLQPKVVDRMKAVMNQNIQLLFSDINARPFCKIFDSVDPSFRLTTNSIRARSKIRGLR